MDIRRRAPPGTWRLLLPASLGWVAAASALPLPGVSRWVWIAALLGGASVYAWAAVDRRGLPLMRGTVLILAVLVLIGVRIDLLEFSRGAPELASAAETGGETRCSGRLGGYPEARASPIGENYWVRAACDTSRGSVPVLLWLDDAPGKDWAPGIRFVAEGEPERFPASSNAAYGVSVRGIEVLEPAGPRELIGAYAAALRAGLASSAEQLGCAELVPGFAVGDTSLVSAETDQAMLVSSLTHLTAVSGSNISLVVAAVLFAASHLGAGRRARIMLGAVGLTVFVLLVGPDASVQRAAVMAAVVLISDFGGKRAVSLPALGAAMLVLLLADPWQALQAGFALSVAATAGILLLAPTLREALSRIPYLPGWLALPVALALAAQIACGPLLLLLRPGLPAGGVIANVLAAPAAPVGTGLGVVALVLLPLGPAGAWLGEAALRGAGLAARWVEATAQVIADLPFATLPWPGGWPGALLLAAVEAALIAAWMLRTGRISLLGIRAARRAPWKGKPQQPSRLRLAVALLAGSAIGVLLAVTVAGPLASRAATPRDWAVVACDVGQGDAILMRDPAAPGEVMLIDTGDDPELLSACLDRFGVSRIALLVLTHDDRDHVGALASIVPLVDAALIAPDTAEDRGDRTVRRTLDRAGIPYVLGEAGLEGGPLGLHWRVLAPREGTVPTDTNASSLVLHLRAGELDVLALGDTGAEEHRALLRGETDLEADVLKVAHHGSGDQDPELIEATGATYGLISVGADNGYGHPARETLDALAAAGTAVLRTDEHGSIAISLRDGRAVAWLERGS